MRAAKLINFMMYLIKNPRFIIVDRIIFDRFVHIRFAKPIHNLDPIYTYLNTMQRRTNSILSQQRNII